MEHRTKLLNLVETNQSLLGIRYDINTQVDNKQTYYSASNNVLMINVPTPQS